MAAPMMLHLDRASALDNRQRAGTERIGSQKASPSCICLPRGVGGEASAHNTPLAERASLSVVPGYRLARSLVSQAIGSEGLGTLAARDDSKICQKLGRALNFPLTGQAAAGEVVSPASPFSRLSPTVPAGGPLATESSP